MKGVLPGRRFGRGLGEMPASDRAVITIAAAGSFVVPQSGVWQICVLGGGGGGYPHGLANAGGGGGGGGLAKKTRYCVAGEKIPYVVGGAGGASICDGMTANPGGTATGKAGALGGTASGGHENYSGGNGGDGCDIGGKAGGGGGSAAGFSGNGANGQNAYWSGSVTTFGAGGICPSPVLSEHHGNGAPNGGEGNPIGANYGGGGGGAGPNNITSYGGTGAVIFTRLGPT